MPQDLKQMILKAIAETHDMHQKATLLLLFQVAEMVAEKIDGLSDRFEEQIRNLSEQMTVDVKQHGEDHRWITEKRQAEKASKEDSHAIALGVKKDLYSRTSQVVFGLLCAGAGWLASLLLSVVTKGVL